MSLRFAHFRVDSQVYLVICCEIAEHAPPHVSRGDMSALKLLRRGAKRARLARELGVSERTVANRLSLLRRRIATPHAALSRARCAPRLARAAKRALFAGTKRAQINWWRGLVLGELKVAGWFRHARLQHVIFRRSAMARPLSDQESLAIAMLVDGCTVKQIAAEQRVSLSASNSYVRRALAKMGLKRRSELRWLELLTVDARPLAT